LLKRKTKREGEGERGTADKQSQAPKKSGVRWVERGRRRGVTVERIVEQPLVVAAAFIAPLQSAPV